MGMKSGFVIVPDEVRLDKGISPVALRVYMVLAGQARTTRSQQCAPIGVRLIAKLALCSRRTAAQSLERLAEKKYIEVLPGPNGQRSRYWMTAKWFIPQVERGGGERTVFQDESVKVVRKPRNTKYQPKSLREESA